MLSWFVDFDGVFSAYQEDVFEDAAIEFSTIRESLEWICMFMSLKQCTKCVSLPLATLAYQQQRAQLRLLLSERVEGGTS